MEETDITNKEDTNLNAEDNSETKEKEDNINNEDSEKNDDSAEHKRTVIESLEMLFAQCITEGLEGKQIDFTNLNETQINFLLSDIEEVEDSSKEV